jgi:hypothetical protein
MHRDFRWRWIGPAALSLLLVANASALAAPPPWAADGSAQTGSANAPSSPPPPTSDAAASGGMHVFGDEVAAAVQAARASGAQGTALAEAVHQVLLTEHPNAKGLAVAEAVYQNRESGDPGAAAFGDLLQQSPWAAGAVGALHSAGVIDGTSATTFDPGSAVTLAELATMLSRLQAGSAASIADAPPGTPDWAQDALAWAEESGVLAGEQGLGGPNDALTRAEAVLMLINAAGLAAQASALGSAPIDLSGTPPDWAHGALALAIQLGILQGSGGQLLADQPLTRAQMAVLLARVAVLEADATSGGS